MLAEKIKQKLSQKKVSIGTWMSMAHPSIAEILAMAGYDWVVVETEHTAIDVSEALRMIIAIEQRGAVPLVRLAGIDPIQAKAVLDSGAAGVIVPMVNTKTDAELAVAMTKYPPMGTRGVGLARAQGYGVEFDDYVQRANKDSLVIVQIEHIDAVNNIEEILSVPGIDGTFIGPYDLSMSLGIPGQLSHPKVVEAKEKVLQAVLRKGLAAGIHFVQPSTALGDCEAAVKAGYTFIAMGTDILFLGDSARAMHTEIRKSVG
jgi:2-keto-3-deoxy-L-rhamnonate aldolase RhmA